MQDTEPFQKGYRINVYLVNRDPTWVYNAKLNLWERKAVTILEVCCDSWKSKIVCEAERQSTNKSGSQSHKKLGAMRKNVINCRLKGKNK